MLLQGYKPSLEPSMILKAHRANRLTDIRTRCKIHVQKGHVLIGCLDETGKLDYGQVYIRITKNCKKQNYSEQPFLTLDWMLGVLLIVLYFLREGKGMLF